MTKKLQDRVAIVTGAGGGFGEGIASHFAELGAKVVVADLRFDSAQAVAAAIEAAGGQAAPDIAGRGIANPIGQIWSAAMLLEHLGETDAARLIVGAIEQVLGAPDAPRTPDLGAAIVRALAH